MERDMPVWRTRPVRQQASVTLRSWQIHQLLNGELHLVGYCVESGSGRVSSLVREFDARTLHFKTRSGRTYALQGRPGGNLDADYVWNRWAALNSATAWKNVSASIWQQHLEAKAPTGPDDLPGPDTGFQSQGERPSQ
jgi:hypothetical protein